MRAGKPRSRHPLGYHTAMRRRQPNSSPPSRVARAIGRALVILLSALAITSALAWPVSYWHVSLTNRSFRDDGHFLVWDIGDDVTIRARDGLASAVVDGGWRESGTGAHWDLRVLGAKVFYDSLPHSSIIPPRISVIVAVPFWMVSLVTLIYPLIVFRRRLRQRHRRRRGACLACGYNLTGNVSGVCPECGADLCSAR